MNLSQAPSSHRKAASARLLRTIAPFAFAAVSAFLFPTAVFSQSTPSADARALATGSISGLLVKPSGGRTAEGLTVTILQTGQTAATDKYGHYGFSGVTPGTYTLLATGPGYSRLRITDVVVQPSHSLELSAQEMPMIVKDGEVQMMEEVIVSARKDVEVMEQVVVTDQKPLPFSDRNVDVPRGIDDVQPYYIFDNQAIDQSGATNVEDFLKRRLTMNTVSQTNSQVYESFVGASSSFNLRGLGANQTLILIDGRRSAGMTAQGVSYQPDVNGVPLAAIDRIEVLPSSASAIYGGSAVGGVINIVLKKDYRGGEIRYTYENTANTDSPIRNLDMTYGFGMEGGKTQVMLSAHYSDGKTLLLQDRLGLAERGIRAILQRQPSFFYSNTTPFYGATPNISLKSGTYRYSVNGVAQTYVNPTNTTLTFKNGVPLNSLVTYVPAGTSSATSPATLDAGLLANAGTYNFNFGGGTDQYGLQDAMGQSPREKSFMATVHRQFLPKLEGFVELSTTSNQTLSILNPFTLYTPFTVSGAAPTNPFEETVSINAPSVVQSPFRTTNMTQTLTVGFIAQLPAGWKSEFDYTWSRSRFSYAFALTDSAALTTALNTGAVNPFVDTIANPMNLSAYLAPLTVTSGGSLNDLALRLSGPLFSLPWGSPTLTVGLEERKDGTGNGAFYEVFPSNPIANTQEFFFGQSQTVRSVYGEADIPLVTAKNALPLVRSVELQLSGRMENYSVGSSSNMFYVFPNNPAQTLSYQQIGADSPLGVHGTTHYTSTTPTVGIKYKPADTVSIRASYAQGFLPPSYSQLLANPSNPPSPGSVYDPHEGRAYSVSVANSGGGNPDLKPQTTASWNLGAIWEPRGGFLDGFRFDAEFYSITEHNVITSAPGGAQYFVTNEADYPGYVTRDPLSGSITQVNNPLINLYKYKTDGWDLSLDYRRKTALGLFELHALGTIVEHYKQQVSLAGRMLDYVGYVADGGPAKTKGNVSLSWEKGPWTLGWTTTYFGSYKQYGSPGSPDVALFGNPFTNYVLLQGGAVIPSQAYHEIFASYAFGRTERRVPSLVLGALDGVTLQIGIKNLFNSVPPLDIRSGPYYYSQYGDPRLRDYWVSLKKAF